MPNMVLDLCPEFYVGSKENLENLVWQPQNEEHQRRRWLAPKVEVAAPKLVSNNVPKAVPASVSGPALTCPPVPTVAPSSERAQRKTTMAPRIAETSQGHVSQACATARTIGGLRQVPTRTLAPAPVPSVLDRSRCPAFPRTIHHPAVYMKAVPQPALPVTMRIVQPAVYVQVPATPQPQPVYRNPIRETSFLGRYQPIVHSSVYVSSRVFFPPRLLVQA